MKHPFTFVNKHDTMPCWCCDATGKINGKTCKTCKGAKTYIETHRIIVTQDCQGNPIAIDTDNLS
jgi:DnaJ-class molecular chaperone